MSIFDLLFLAAVVATIAVLVSSAIAAVRGHRAEAFRILRIWLICVTVYLAAGLAVSFLRPQRLMQAGAPWCFDDWCLTVEGVNRTMAGNQADYKIELRISSQAARITQRANGAWIYRPYYRTRRRLLRCYVIADHRRERMSVWETCHDSASLNAVLPDKRRRSCSTQGPG